MKAMKTDEATLFENRRRAIGTMPVLAVCCGLLTAVALGLWTSERSHVRALERNRVQTAAELDQAKSQIQDLAGRLKTLTEKTITENPVVRSEPAPVQVALPAAPRTAPPTSRKRLERPGRPVITVDRRLDRLQGQLTETQKTLASTREELASAREQAGRDKEELDGKLNSTRDDLNGSIARTHDEVVALQKRGELNVYEFKLTKSKEMHRVGPLSISLRGANAKRKSYDLAMMVDDNALNKRNVNLFEPVWITLGDRPQPVQLVVNHVEKNEIEGYVSEPKYRKSELLANSAQPAPARPSQLSTRDQSASNQ
jgi:septal ring factor EnvC (AmiA/AmiB activator)